MRCSAGSRRCWHSRLGCAPGAAAPHDGAWRSPRHGRAGAGGGSGAHRDPPLLNHFRLPSSHEKYKPEPGCHGAGLSCGSLKPIPPKEVSAGQALPAPRRPGSTMAATECHTRGPCAATALGTALPTAAQSPTGMVALVLVTPSRHRYTEVVAVVVQTGPAQRLRPGTSPTLHGAGTCWPGGITLFMGS